MAINVDNLNKFSRRTSVFFLISLLCWPLLAFGSMFMFDAPGSEKSVILWLLLWTIWSYPLIVLVSAVARIILSKIHKPFIAFVFSLLPLINVLIVGVFLVCSYVFEQLSWHKKIHSTQQGPKCIDGRYLEVNDRQEIYIVSLKDNMYCSTHVGDLVDNKFKFFSNIDDKDCASEQTCLQYLMRCKDKNGKTVFDKSVP